MTENLNRKGEQHAMSKDEFVAYVSENFTVSGEYLRLLGDVIYYAECSKALGLMNIEQARDYLLFVLSGNIGLTVEEIERLDVLAGII